MVQKMKIYRCQECGRIYDRYEDAVKCEQSDIKGERIFFNELGKTYQQSSYINKVEFLEKKLSNLMGIAREFRIHKNTFYSIVFSLRYKIIRIRGGEI